MTFAQRARRQASRIASLGFVILSATTLALATAGAMDPVISAFANGCGGEEQGAWSSYGHGWLGYCTDGWNDVQYYTGEDGGNVTPSGQQTHLRGWQCGTLLYDQTLTTYNTPVIRLRTPWYWYACGAAQTDSDSGEWVDGSFSWWWYLHF